MHTPHILGGYLFRQRATGARRHFPDEAIDRLAQSASLHNAQAFARAATEDPDFVEGDEARWDTQVTEPFGAALFDWVRANNAIPDDEQICMVLDWVLVQAGYSPGAVA